MPSRLAIDDVLLEQTQKLGKHRTKRETVNAALQEYIQRQYQEGRGYKGERRSKRS